MLFLFKNLLKKLLVFRKITYCICFLLITIHPASQAKDQSSEDKNKLNESAYTDNNLGSGDFKNGKKNQTKYQSNDLSLGGYIDAFTNNAGDFVIQTDVYNRRSTGWSGSLRLELWALDEKYSGGSWFGYKIGQIQLGSLLAGNYYQSINKSTPRITTPPAGTWHITLILTEYENGSLNEGYFGKDFYNFSDPWIISGGSNPNSTVIVYELYNTITKHYFRTASLSELNGIESGSAGSGWIRTRDDFKAYAPSTVVAGNDVCRFYSKNYNSHFYTASIAECNSIKYNPASEWKYEGMAFHILPPINGGCIAGLKTIYRLYNNKHAQKDSNHRFTSYFSEVERLQQPPENWVYEGVAFCTFMQ